MKRILVISLAVIVPTGLWAQWTAAPETYVTIVDTLGGQNKPHSVMDGADGSITVWEDGRSGNGDVYAQRIDAGGNPLWEPNGVPVCVESSSQSWPDCVADGAGGIVVAWFDDRSGIDSVYAQRIDANGEPAWPVNGVELFASTTGSGYLEIVSDGSGGAYVAWIKGAVVSAQHVDGTGLVSWPSPIVVCDAPNAKSETIGLADGAGGATFAWVDGRFLGNPKIYAQNVQSDGSMSWLDDGVILATDGVDQRSIALTSDGAGGALFAWQDYRDAPSLGINLWAQHLLPSGAIAWGSTGKPICEAVSTQNGPRMTSVPGGGALVAWGDWRHGGSNLEQIYIQRIDVDGEPLWPVDGVRVAPTDHAQGAPLVASDGAGGAHVVWGALFDVYARSIDAAGTPLGSSVGDLFIAHPQWDYTQTIVSTSDGSAIVTVAPSNDNLFCDKIGVVDLPGFIRADANADGTVNIADAQFILSYLFVSGSPVPSCLAAADANAGGAIDISDAVFTLDYLFVMGPPPAAPFPNCGTDASTPLSCDSFLPCP